MTMSGFSEHGPALVVGHFLGLRWFTLSDGGSAGPKLTGARGEWQPGENVAGCLNYGFRNVMEAATKQHQVPVKECGCGYWAYWSLGMPQVSMPRVAGIVKGYGRYVKGPLGFRVEKAEIQALSLLSYKEDDALALEDRFKVPVYGNPLAMIAMTSYLAPSEQPPLSDDWFWREATRQRQWLNSAARRGQGALAMPEGGKEAFESVMDYARRAGFLPPLAPCTRCGRPDAHVGRALCEACYARDVLHELDEQVARRPTPAELVNLLHERRERWAREIAAGLPASEPPSPPS